MPRAGRLNRRIELQSVSTSQDDFGTVIETATTFATVWAAIDVPMSQGQQETFQVDKITSQITHRITIRFRPDVTALDRVKLGTRTWKILQVQNPKDGFRQLTLVSREIVSGEPI